ncbi:hypothetical protein LTR84_010475 [Exophiala bonariae]|uniref:DUF5648 domain-containing protein n=1 Tax=Exophiala bonariae TaxID=1690606 RepID=A0AAV9MTS7_9EURO|nr:hypothetical protein LTR84_010475 [Exophiala bonariae]
MPDHFYTLDFAGELAPGNYEREGITGYVYTSMQPNTVAIYRWYNSTSHDHFYTADPGGELAPQNYKYEGIAWYMFNQRQVNTVALYRWYNSESGDHFYTADATGELGPPAYKSEGILGYMHPNPTNHAVPIYRWWESGLLSNFSFDDDITEAQRRKLLERHTWAFYRAGICGNIGAEEKEKVRAVYRQGIRHSATTLPGVNAYVPDLNARHLFINFNNLFPQGDREIAQTLLHEMMHCAGYPHPAHIDSGPNIDRPYDGGKYYGTAPLRSELCIDGVQSDTSTVGMVLASYAVTQTELRACPVVNPTAQANEATAPGDVVTQA